MFLAEPWPIGSRKAPNRLVALPMESNDANPEGAPSALTIERYRRLAAAGWGVIIIEAVAPSINARARPHQLILNHANIEAFTGFIRLIREVAPEPPVIILQANHAGRHAFNPLIAYPMDGEATEDTTTNEIDSALKEIIHLSELAAQIGADGVDVKCCHGYLAVDLLRPASTRADKYGGDFEGRSRFILDAISETRKVTPKDFLVGSRISFYEGFPGGFGVDWNDPKAFDPEEPQKLADALMKIGVDFICETLGNPYRNPEWVRPPKKHPEMRDITSRHHEMSRWIKNRMPGVAVIGAGYTMLGNGFHIAAECNILEESIDGIGFGRQTFADPEMPIKLFTEAFDNIRHCVGCADNNCSTLLRADARAGCVVHNPEYREILKSLKKG